MNKPKPFFLVYLHWSLQCNCSSYYKLNLSGFTMLNDSRGCLLAQVRPRAPEHIYPLYPGYTTIICLVRQSRAGITKLDRQNAET